MIELDPLLLNYQPSGPPVGGGPSHPTDEDPPTDESSRVAQTSDSVELSIALPEGPGSFPSPAADREEPPPTPYTALPTYSSGQQPQAGTATGGLLDTVG